MAETRKNLACRIRKMAADFDVEHIAQAVGVPVQVVQGVIDGRVDDDVLQDFDPARPPDVRMVKERKFIRSRLVGVLSTGGCGATTLASALALASAGNSKQTVGVLDLNECAALGDALGMETFGEGIALYPNITWLLDQEPTDNLFVRHPKVERLMVLPGAVTARHHAKLSADLITKVLDMMSRTFSATWVDCPSSPKLWEHVLPDLDFLLYMLRADRASLASLWRTAPVLRHLGVSDRCAVVISYAGGAGWMGLAECRRAVREASDLQVLAALPEDPGLRREQAGCTGATPAYKDAVTSILDEVCPERVPRQKKGFMKSLAGLLGR